MMVIMRYFVIHAVVKFDTTTFQLQLSEVGQRYVSTY
jgi:hypothetical protein